MTWKFFLSNLLLLLNIRLQKACDKLTRREHQKQLGTFLEPQCSLRQRVAEQLEFASSRILSFIKHDLLFLFTTNNNVKEEEKIFYFCVEQNEKKNLMRWRREEIVCLKFENQRVAVEGTRISILFIQVRMVSFYSSSKDGGTGLI